MIGDRFLLATALDALIAALLAPPCAVCQTPLERPLQGPVCAACWAGIRLVVPPVCDGCGHMLPGSRQPALCGRCRRRPGAVDRARSLGLYDGRLRAIVHAFKYDGRRSLSARLGDRLRDAGADLLADATCAVPVPLHPWRRLRRGFNQSGDLALRLQCPVVHALWRVRATAPQAGLTAGERRRNLRGAFAISPLLGRRARARLAGIVVLVDDVRTTGATLDACAGVLKTAGAKEVRALSVALAEPPAGGRRGS